MPNGIPSHDTFARVFARIDPEQFQRSFLNWIQSIEKVTEKEVVAIDGKTLRRSYDTKSEKSAIYISSLFLSAEELAGAIRNHWGIENSCHWILDVAFNEDRLFKIGNRRAVFNGNSR